MRKRIQIVLYIIILLLLIFLAYFIYDIYVNISAKPSNEIEVIDTIEAYGYSLDEEDSLYMVEEYNILKEILNKDEIIEIDYANSIAKLFVIDFYSLDSSINKNDIGGVQFIYESYEDNFILKAKSTIYKNLENNIYGTREQTLPLVKNVTIVSNEIIEYLSTDYGDTQAYSIELNVEYEIDLDYPTKVNLILIHDLDKLEIVEIK